MATLERSTATLDGPAERAIPAFDPTAVPRDVVELAQLSRQEHAHAEQEQDLIDLGREQLFAGSIRPAARDRQQDAADSRTVHATALQAGAEHSQDAMVRLPLHSSQVRS